MIDHDLMKKALIIRKFEEKLFSLFSEGKLQGTVHTCVGQELTGLAAARALKANDTIFSNHRCHGHFLAWTDDLCGLFAEILGKSIGVCGGIGGSQHLHWNGFYSNGIQGGMIPIAVGKALAEKMAGSGNICLAFIGDGTWGQGVLYESLNIASKHDVPILVAVENNMYAQSTHISETLAGSIQDRAKAFDIEYGLTSTWQPESLFDDFEKAVRFVRTRSKPYILEVETYRLKAHSKGDDHRDEAEITKYQEIDPLNIWVSEGTPEAAEAVKEVEEVVEKELQRAIGADTLPFVRLCPPVFDRDIKWEDVSFEKDRIVALINQTLKDNMRENPKIVMIGQDLKSPYGGAFKTTRELDTMFPGRVFNMPISEGAIVGVGTGLTFGDHLSIVEIMFGDFLTLAFDQLLNHACKFPFMYNNKVNVPLVVRTPMGGRRGYGPTHSQSLEKHFLGIPNLDVLALNCRVSPRCIYDNLLGTVSLPTLVIENKVLYTRYLHTEQIAGFEVSFSTEKYPAVRIYPKDKKPEITIFCYGGTLEEVEKAVAEVFEEDEIVCEVICPSMIHPLNINPVLESVGRTKKLLIVEEGSSFAALSGEVIAKVIENGVTLERARRVSWNNYIPAAFALERHALPNTEIIAQEMRELANE